MTFGNTSTISDRRLKIAFACIIGTMHSVVYYSIKYLFIEDTRLDYVNWRLYGFELNAPKPLLVAFTLAVVRVHIIVLSSVSCIWQYSLAVKYIELNTRLTTNLKITVI